MPAIAPKRKASERHSKGSSLPPMMDRMSPRLRRLCEKYNSIPASVAAAAELAKEVYSTGSLGLDLAIGRMDHIFKTGGIPARSIVEIFGPNGSTKSLLLEHLILSVQRRGKLAVVYYTEQPDFERMKRLGIDIDLMIVLPGWEPLRNFDAKVNLAEVRLRQLVNWGKEDDVALIAIDSVKGMVGSGQLYKKGKKVAKDTDRGFEESDTAIRAQLMEKFFNRAKYHVKNAMIVLINQTNEKIGNDFVKGEKLRPTTSGGRRKEFEALIRIEIASAPLEDEKHSLLPYKPQIGQEVFYSLVKNRYSKFTGCRRVVSKFWYEDQAFDTTDELLSYAVYLSLVKRKGNSYTFFKSDGVTVLKKKVGRKKAHAYLKGMPKLHARLMRLVTERSEDLFRRKINEKRTLKSALVEDARRRSDDKSSGVKRVKSKNFGYVEKHRNWREEDEADQEELMAA